MPQNNNQLTDKFRKSPDKNSAKQLSPKVLLVILLFAVCAAVLIVHWPTLSAKALSFDDNQYLTENLLVQNPCLKSIWRFLGEILHPSTVHGYYQPLTMISLMLDYALGGRENNLLPFHHTSLVLHAANTALIIVLLYLLFGRPWIAAGVGLLFGIHPMTIEPIPWIGERKTLLAAFFSLWCLIIYVYSQAANYKPQAAKDFRRSTKLSYVICFVMYLLALMSKPTSVPLPALLLALDYWPLKRLKWRTVREKLPFFVLGGIFAVITYISQSRTAQTTLPTESGLARMLLILCHNIVFYLYKIIWPVNLSSHYAFPKPLALSHPAVLAGVIGTCILMLLLIISLRWTRAVLTGWLFFFVAILPTMQIIGFSNVIASDKYAYLPSVGLLMILASFLGWCCGADKPLPCRALTAVTILFLAGAESAATRNQLVHWRDSLSLFEYMLTLTPNSAPLHNHLGVALVKQENIDGAMVHFAEAVRLDPENEKAQYNLGLAYAKKEMLEKAAVCLRKSLQLAPDDPYTLINLAAVLIINKESPVYDCNEALRLAERACKLTDYRNSEMLRILTKAQSATGRKAK